MTVISATASGVRTKLGTLSGSFSIAMPRLSWSRMMTDHPACHLVVGRLPVRGARGRAADRQAAHREELLGRLAMTLKWAGAWAVTSIKDPDGLAHVHLVFERQADAYRFANTVKAKASGRHPGWASEREFALNSTNEARIAAALVTAGEVDER